LNKQQTLAAALEILRRTGGFESKNKPVWQAAKPVSDYLDQLQAANQPFQSTTTGAPTFTLS
jgi:hypothetical protein